MGHKNTDRGFLASLARDVRGNTIAIMAAAMLPLAGLIGGGVDMSRMYLVKTRLQQACDAGALAGRKAMAAGSWSTGVNNGSTNDQAEKVFNVNFAAGQYGTGALTKAYSESSGTVTGTASVIVPMTIMKVFGMQRRTLSISCASKMEIPNTDVMFVLDVTGSMNCAPGTNCYNSSPVSGAKITGLKSAVKCFYEALERVNTSEVCGNDPTATNSTTTAQIRFGFVPYTVNVNVGNLLPNDDMADSWIYQSREALTDTAHGWSLGNETAISGWGSWGSAPSTLTSQNYYSNWSDISTSGGSTVTVNGTSYAKRPRGYNSTTCTNLNAIGPYGNKMLAYTDNGGTLQSPTVTSTTNDPPTWGSPAPTQQHLSYSQDNNHAVVGYKYRWRSSSCRLQKSATRTYSVTRRGGQSTKAIIWTDYPGAFQGWQYKPVSLNVSGLKAGGSSWNASVNLPLGLSNGPSVTLSGSSSAQTIQYVANTAVSWDGCIEERQTFQNSDGVFSDDWSPIPASAYDMNIDLLPGAGVAGSQWGPALQNAVWARYNVYSNGYSSCGKSSDTVSWVTTTCNLSRNNSYYCPSPASRLAIYNTPANFETYVDGLSAGGNTYHDIGMLWGARLISPSGIFASANAYTPGGQAIKRHLIFMTDGATSTSTTNYTAYGTSWWDRRQTNAAPSSSDLDDIVNARLDALCAAVKNMNITLWVVSFGGGVDAATETRLQNCATPNHYYTAADNAALITSFQQIASKISELRLTS